jgi:protein TonB
VKYQGLTFAFTVSLSIHLVMVPMALILFAGARAVPLDRIDVTLIDLHKAEKKEPVIQEPKRPAREEKVTPPKLLQKKKDIIQPAPTASVVEPPHPLPPRTDPERIQPVGPTPPTAERKAPPQGGLTASSPEKDRPRGRGVDGSHTIGNAGAGATFGSGDVAVTTGSGGRGGGGEGSANTRPYTIHQVKPRYPESARRAGIEGVTLLRIRVLENGRVGDVFIEKSSGSDDLDNAASEGVKEWRFEPARRGREPIPSWVLLPMRFELQ